MQLIVLGLIYHILLKVLPVSSYALFKHTEILKVLKLVLHVNYISANVMQCQVKNVLEAFLSFRLCSMFKDSRLYYMYMILF